MPSSPKRGRPVKAAAQRATQYLRIRLRPGDLDLIRRAAALDDRSVPLWCRATLRRAAVRALRGKSGRD